MCAFANGDTPGPYLHPVVRSILLHFWLAWDHPFVDGNGRTARALFYASMLRHRYWVVEYLPISRKLHQAPAQYARAFLLTETDGRDATYFLLHQLRVLVAALDDLDAHVARSREKTRDMVRALHLEGALNPRQLALVEHARAHPGAAFTVRSHERSAGVSYPTARSDLLDLEARGVFRAWMRGRERVFVAATDLDAVLRGLHAR
jgi:Fic family protein